MANSKIYSTFFLVATAHLANNTLIKITWKNDKPIQTKQWLFTKEKLKATKELIDTQLKLKHIEESYSPDNQFSFQSQRKAMPKKAQTLTQLHLSHTLVK